MNKSVVFLSLLVTVLAGCNRYASSPDQANTHGEPTQEANQGLQVEDNMIYVASQPPGTQIVINTVSLEIPGYVVIHKVDEKGNPGELIGHSNVIEGSNQQVNITLSSPVKEGETLFAMLHSDDGNGTFEFPGNDKPVVGKLSPDPMGMRFEIGNGSEEEPVISL